MIRDVVILCYLHWCIFVTGRYYNARLSILRFFPPTSTIQAHPYTRKFLSDNNLLSQNMLHEAVDKQSFERYINFADWTLPGGARCANNRPKKCLSIKTINMPTRSAPDRSLDKSRTRSK
eukprot:623458_1